MTLDNIIARKLKEKHPDPVDIREFRKRIVYTRLSYKDSGYIIRNMKKNNLITIRRKIVWLR